MKMLCVTAISFMITTTALGQKVARAYNAPYGKAGCGLGSVIIKDKDKNSQIFASVINAYVGFVSSSITSGTSNCNYVNPTAQMEQKVYISANLKSLEKEAVRGSGMHLNALAALFGCEDSSAQTLFQRFNKDYFERIYSTNDPDAVYKNFKAAGLEHGEVVGTCPGLS